MCHNFLKLLNQNKPELPFLSTKGPSWANKNPKKASDSDVPRLADQTIPKNGPINQRMTITHGFVHFLSSRFSLNYTLFNIFWYYKWDWKTLARTLFESPEVVQVPIRLDLPEGTTLDDIIKGLQRPLIAYGWTKASYKRLYPNRPIPPFDDKIHGSLMPVRDSSKEDLESFEVHQTAIINALLALVSNSLSAPSISFDFGFSFAELVQSMGLPLACWRSLVLFYWVQRSWPFAFDPGLELEIKESVIKAALEMLKNYQDMEHSPNMENSSYVIGAAWISWWIENYFGPLLSIELLWICLGRFFFWAASFRLTYFLFGRFFRIDEKELSFILPTRIDYGGRSSQLCSSLPLSVFTLFLSLIYVLHSSHYGSTLWLLWILLGFSLMVQEWVRIGLYESFLQYTSSARVNGLACFALLIVFESLFFGGVFWIYCLNNVHSHCELSLRSSNLGNDLSIFGTYESGFLSFTHMVFDDQLGFLSFVTPFSQSLLGENLLAIYLNLWLLLAVTLVLQLSLVFSTIFS